MYQADPDAPPDADFAPGELRWLVPGNRGRLMDGRRTPIRVTAIDLDHGWFGVEILAFEDTGARWLVPLEEVVRYQFEPDGENARAAQIAAMAAAIRRFDVPAEIIADPAAGRRSRDRIARHRAAADEWLTSQGVPARIDPEPFIQSRQGSPDAPAWLAGYLTATGSGLAALDEQLAAAYVSNPNSGDLIRAHLIVLAELGLSDYRGKSLRDEAALAGRLNRAARTGHIVARAGFVQALWARADRPGLMLYRGIGLPGPARLVVRTGSLISATFARPVAESHFNGLTSEAAALLRCRLPADRLFMTFLETPALNRQFREAEAVLLPGDGLI